MRRLLLLLTAVALLATACGGSAEPDPALTDPAAPGDPTSSEDALPTAPETSAPLGARPEDVPPLPAELCAEDEPDCEDTLDAGAAAGSCLVGDTDCTDESWNGQDVAREVPVNDDYPDDGTAMERDTSIEATGASIDTAAADGSTLTLRVVGTSCDRLSDTVVVESPEEVRVLVLTGGSQDCDAAGVAYDVEVELAEPLGDRMLLDLAG